MASLRTGLLQAPWDMYGPWKDMPSIKGDLGWNPFDQARLSTEYFHPADLMEMFEDEQTERNRWLDKIEEKEFRKKWEVRPTGPITKNSDLGIFTMPEDQERLKERHKDPVLDILDEIRESGIWDRFPFTEGRPKLREPRSPMEDQYKFGGWQ